jgi:hypothetical protein
MFQVAGKLQHDLICLQSNLYKPVQTFFCTPLPCVAAAAGGGVHAAAAGRASAGVPLPARPSTLPDAPRDS